MEDGDWKELVNSLVDAKRCLGSALARSDHGVTLADETVPIGRAGAARTREAAAAAAGGLQLPADGPSSGGPGAGVAGLLIALVASMALVGTRRRRS